MAQKPRAQLRPNPAKLGRGHDGHAPTDDGADAQDAALPGRGMTAGPPFSFVAEPVDYDAP
jgi:hypothetical protein